MASSLRGNCAIVGTAESDLGEVAPGMTPVDLTAQAIVRALEDCGLRLGDVDGVFTATTQTRMIAMAVSEYLGITPRYFDSTQVGGSSFMAHVAHARAAIAAGCCEVAVIAYGSTQRSVSRKFASPPERNAYEDPYRPMMPPSAYALAASRHMHQYGTTREQLAEVAVAARKWAQRNPKAFMREDLSVRDVLDARMVSDPFTVRDCCLVTDGGGAIVLTSAERARDLKHRPAYILGTGEHISHNVITMMPDLTVSGAAHSGPLAFAEAGVAPRDIDAINGHLTGTFADPHEVHNWSAALERAPADFPLINSTKSLIGHGLGAAGGLELVACVLQLRGGFVHASRNCEDLHDKLAPFAGSIVRETVSPGRLEVIAKASFGFGDVNGCVVLRNWR
jgi:acetyl-CoA acetyltransferase